MIGVRTLRRGGLVAVCSLACAAAGAQQPAVSASELAHLVDRRYDTLHSLKAEFTESYQGLGIERSEGGTLLLEKPGRMRWNYSSPAGKLFLLDGKYAWFYTPGDPQAQRVPAKELDDLRSPLRFLLGHTDLEKELTGLRLSSPAGQNGIAVLIGQPKGQEKRVSRLCLNVAKDTGAIVGIEIDEADGAITRFTFMDQRLDEPIPAGTFQFTPPAGVVVANGLPPV
jgi:outer membrane lipoprotein carrier protein